MYLLAQNKKLNNLPFVVQLEQPYYTAILHPFATDAAFIDFANAHTGFTLNVPGYRLMLQLTGTLDGGKILLSGGYEAHLNETLHRMASFVLQHIAATGDYAHYIL